MKELYLGKITERCIPLWHSAFGDKKEQIARAIELLADSALYAAITDDGLPLTQCVMIEHRLSVHRGLYIYAACTDERFRAHGLFSDLLERCAECASERGFDFLSLIPASDALSRFYEKRGFTLPCRLSASCDPSDSYDFYRSIDPILYSEEEFDQDFALLYSLSDKRLPFGAFVYTCETLSQVCEIVYANRKSGYVIRHYEDKSRIFDASFDLKKLASTEEKSKQSSLLIRNLRSGSSVANDVCADPLPR